MAGAGQVQYPTIDADKQHGPTPSPPIGYPPPTPPAGYPATQPTYGAAGYSGSPQQTYGVPPPRPGMYYAPPPAVATPANQWMGGAPTGYGNTPIDIEAQVMHSFAERQVRQGFMRKVFGIVALQLAVTVGFAFVCMFVKPIKSYVQSTPWPFYLSWGLSFGFLLFISCNESLRRKYPTNMIVLGLFTLFEAFLVGMITSFFDIEVVLLAFLCTCVAVGMLALLACQNRVDITHWGPLMTIPLMLFITLLFVGLFWVNKIVYLVISGVAALLSCIFIVYDLQLIMGGKQFAISPDEYVFAALSLYLDIVNLFIWLLNILGLATQQ